MKRTTWLLFCLACAANARAADVVAILNIDSVGAEKVAMAKSMQGVDWWIELGSRLIVSGDEAHIGAWNEVPLLSLHPAMSPEDLLLLTPTHCSGDHDHQRHSKLLQDPFLQVPGATVTLRRAKSLLPEQQPLAANQVVAVQLANRQISPMSENFSTLVDQISVENYRETLATLAQFNRQRNDELFDAIEWLEGELSELPLDLRRETYPPLPSRPPNLIAIQRGATNPDDVLVIGAHLDSRNAARDNTLPSPGAEDNASGSAAVLEIARVLAGSTPKSTIVYAWFTSEEIGLVGSTGWVEQQQDAGTQIRAMLNMDMISYSSVPKQRAAIISTTFAADLLDDLAASGAEHTDLQLVLRYNTCCSDHAPFLDAGIPAVSSIQADRTTYPHYHRATDTIDHLTPELGVQIARMNAGLLADLAGIEPDGVAFEVSGGISGYWYDPDQAGQGFQVEVLTGGDAVLTWYTFDEEGNQLWLIGSGRADGDTIEVDLLEPSGGAFPPNFDAATVQLNPWGTAILRFASCSVGSVDYQPLGGELTPGNMPLVRLTRPGGLDCP